MVGNDAADTRTESRRSVIAVVGVPQSPVDTRTPGAVRGSAAVDAAGVARVSRPARAARPGRARTWVGGLLRALSEVALVVVLYAAYSATRLLADGDVPRATANAREVLRIETWLHLDVERSLNAWLTRMPDLALAASYWYVTLHFVLTPTVLVLLYLRRPDVYVKARTVLALATMGALVGYLLLPTAPPRMLPGFTDTLASTAGSGWWGGASSAESGVGRATNELAAMPSLHVGWALWVSGALMLLVRRRWQRVLAAGYVVGTTLVVVGTANHWVLDAVAGAGLVVAAAGAVALASRSRQQRRSTAARAAIGPCRAS